RDFGSALAGRPASVEIAAALDEWSFIRRYEIGAEEASWRRLVEAARAADPDPWRNRLRSALGLPSDELRATLRRLADEAKARSSHPVAGGAEAGPSQPTFGLLLLSDALKRMGDRDRASAVLRDAWRREPGDFWVNFELGNLSWDPRQG